jgi:hypothetical protein
MSDLAWRRYGTIHKAKVGKIVLRAWLGTAGWRWRVDYAMTRTGVVLRGATKGEIKAKQSAEATVPKVLKALKVLGVKKL